MIISLWAAGIVKLITKSISLSSRISSTDKALTLYLDAALEAASLLISAQATILKLLNIFSTFVQT